MPIRIRNRRLVCENSRFDVYFDDIVDQAGYEVHDYLVVAPKQRVGNMITGVAILPVLDRQVGLVRIYRPALRDYSWEIPHGFVEEGESEQASAMRELLEETGLHGVEVISLGHITPDAGIIAARVHVYLVLSSRATVRQLGEMGLREFRLFPIAEFERMVLASEIQDSFTLAAWCRFRLSPYGRDKPIPSAHSPV
jgi:ADP-ribose pyrophosphatase